MINGSVAVLLDDIIYKTVTLRNKNSTGTCLLGNSGREKYTIEHNTKIKGTLALKMSRFSAIRQKSTRVLSNSKISQKHI